MWGENATERPDQEIILLRKDYPARDLNPAKWILDLLRRMLLAAKTKTMVEKHGRVSHIPTLFVAWKQFFKNLYRCVHLLKADTNLGLVYSYSWIETPQFFFEGIEGRRTTWSLQSSCPHVGNGASKSSGNKGCYIFTVPMDYCGINMTPCSQMLVNMVYTR